MTSRNSHRRGASLLGRLLVAATFVLGMATAHAEIFNESPARLIGPANDVPIGASIGGQGGWAVSCSPTKYDEEISHDRARAGMQSWRVSNWFHEGCVNSVLSPAFASVAEGSSPNNNVVNSFWFNVPTGNTGLTISASLGDAPGQRLTYAAIVDDGATLRVQAVGILNGSGFAGPPLPAPFDDPGVEYQIANSAALNHDTWYQLRVSLQLVAGARDDTVLYEVLDDVGNVVWTSGSMKSWEDAYLAGPFAPPGTKVTVTRLGFRIIENPDHLAVRPPYGYATNRPVGVYIDDLSVLPGGGQPLHVGFEADRYVGPAGTDSGTCGDPLNRCATIGYAVAQADIYSTVHIAAGTYDESVTITKEGLQLIGDDPNNKPLLTRTAGGTNQPLLVVNGAENVRIENLDFGMDESFVAEGVLANGFVDGLAIVGNHFGASKSTAASSTFRYRNAISINLVNNTQGFPRVNGSSVLIDGNDIDGANSPAFLRSGVSMDASLGAISNNTIMAGTHDIVVRFATVTGASTGDSVSITGNTLAGRGLEFSSPNAGVSQITIDANIISAFPGIDDTTNYPADYSLVRMIHNLPGIPTTISGNQFLDHQGKYRGVLIENFPDIALTGNVFTPAANASDFVSLVISNKEITSDNPASAPLPMSITATGNTFNGNGVLNSGVGTAVELLNDNDAGATATFGSLLFGSAGQENQFSGDLRWYFHLDDFNCDTVATPCTFLNYAGVGAITNTEVRPFAGNVSAPDNLFDGQPPSAANAASLQAHTYDNGANSALGTVTYGVTATELEAFVDDAFVGATYGDALPFTHGATSPGTVYFGINAFATIADGVMNVVDGGQVYVAKGTYPASVSLDHEVQVIGDGAADSDPNNSTVITAGVVITASGSAAVSPLLLQNLRISNPAGNGVHLPGVSQYLEFSGVHFTGNASAALNFNNQTDHVLLDAVTFDGNTAMGIRTSTTAKVSDVAIIDSMFRNNGQGGIILFGASGSGNGQIVDWMIDNTQFLSNADADTTTFGGGIWIKTGGAGSIIDGFSVTNSTFSDNGSSNTLNQVGITIRARPNTTMQNVLICDSTFSETVLPGTQLTGINVFDDTGNTGYKPIEVCASNIFNGVAHSVSGLEQFTLRGTQPVVDITGGTIVGTEYINGFVVRVRDNVTFPTISAAMNDAGTIDGDTIQAPAGLYHENVTVTHDDMTLVGVGSGTIIDGASLAGSGITVPSGRTGITIVNLAVQNFAAIGTSSGACIHGVAANDGIEIIGTTISNCQGGRGGVYLGGPVDDVLIVQNDISNVDGRGIVIWDGFKSHITIANNTVHDMTGCCGIELQDGTASGVTVTDNVVENVGDSGMAFIGLTSGAGPNVITNNTLTNTGRFGIEIKLPNGTGATSGDGSIVVAGNIVTRPASPTSTDVRDIAGIAVIRRSYCPTCGETDITKGVVVTGNTVSGWTQASANDGFGIVAEGNDMHVFGNTVSGSEIGIQLQAGNDNYPGDSNQAATNDYFSRGNSPQSCIDLGANNFSGNGIDSRSVTNPPGGDLGGGAHNGAQYYCTIQAAINAALPGDTITVDAGNYPENVVVNKSITLQGAFAGTIGDDPTRMGTGEAALNPASGQALTLAADNAVFDGFTILGNAGVAVGPGGASRDNMQFINNRVVNIANGTGIRFEPGEGTPASGLQISGNLFGNIRGTGLNGVGIQLYKGTRTAVVSNNVFDGLENIAIQINGGNGSVDGVTVSGNITRDTAPLGDANNALVVTNADNVTVQGNTFDKIATGLFLSDDDSNITATCNTIVASNRGVSSFDFFGGIQNTDISILHNAISGANADLRNGLAQNLVIGSNWYDNAAPSTEGSGLLIANALTANPIGNPLCGNNAPVAITAISGTPQSTTVNAPFALPLVARVTDALGGAVAGDPVAFNAPGAGASAVLSPASANTDYNGFVSTGATANAFAGSYAVSATDGIASAASFALTNNAGTGAFLDLNGPVADVQQGVPTMYTGHIVNTGAALSENALVHVVIASDRAGGIQAGDVVAEYNLGGGWQPLPLAFVGGALVVDYGPPGGFLIPAGYDVTTNFRFTFNHADNPQTTYMATASLVGVTSSTVYATDLLATGVVPATVNVSLSINGPTDSDVGVPTPYLTRITNTGSPTPDNVVVNFMIGRSGGIDPGDITMDSGITLTACGSQLCGTFGAPGFPVPNGFDMSQVVNVTSHRAGSYSVSSTVEGVTSGTTYATASFLVEAGATGVDVDLDGPSAGVEVGGAAIYTVRLDNPSTDPLSQPAVFAFEITNVPGPIVAGDIFSVEFDDGTGYQTVTAQGLPGPNGFLYEFDNGGTGYAVAATSTFVGHVRVHFASPTDYQLRLTADGLGSPAESYGSDQVNTTVIAPTTDIEFTVTGPVSGVEVGNDTVYVGHLRNHGATLPEQVHSQFCLTRDGNPVAAGDLVGDIAFSGSGGTFTAPLVLDAGGCAVLGDETLVGGWDQTATFTLNYAQPGAYVIMGELVGATTGTIYAALNQSTLVTQPTGGRTLSLDGPLSGVGVGEDVAYLGSYHNGGSAIPGNQEFILCVTRDGTAAANTDVGIAWDTDGSGSYANTLTLDGAGCAQVDAAFASTAGFDFDAELRYTHQHVGTYVSTATVRSVANPATIYASDTATTVVDPGQALVSLSNLVQAYDGTPKSATVNTVPGGLMVDVTYDGSATPPTAAGSYAVVATVTEVDWTGSANGTLVISDTAGISLALAGPGVADFGSYVPGYVATIDNTGGLTAQAVHYRATVVRIDDGNFDPIAATDVDACVGIGNGFPGDCSAGFFSLQVGKTTGSHDGRPAVFFRYPNLPANDLPLPNTAGPQPIPFEIRFAPGQYRLLTEVVGADNTTIYATSSTLVTTVPDAAIALDGSFTGSAEQSLLSTTTLTNFGGPLPENVLVRLTLTDTSSAPLVSADAEFAYQVGGSYQTLPWTEQAGALVTLFGPPVTGFPVSDGYNSTTAGRGIFHRLGQYDLLIEVLDAATLTTVYASDTHAFDIDPLAVAITLNDLTQTYDGSPRPVAVSTAPSVPPGTVDVIYTGSGSTSYGPTAVPPIDAGSYDVTADATGLYSGHATGSLVVNPANAVVTIDPLSLVWTFDGSPHAAVVTTSPPGLSVAITYDGSATPPTNAGSYIVDATVTEPNWQGSATDILVIATVGGTSIVLDDDDGTPDGTIHRAFTGSPVAPVTATTTPAGVSYAVTYVGDGGTVYPLTATPPTAAGQYHVEATTTDPNYDVVSANGTLVVDVQVATIALDAGTLNATYDGATHAVSATTTPAGLAYSVTYDGVATPPVDAGSYAVVATITDLDFSGTANGTLVIAKAVGVVSFGATNYTFDGAPHDTTAVISQEPGDTSACTLTASTGDYPRTNAGSTTVDAVCDGSNWTASASTTLVVSPKPVTIALAGTGTFVYDAGPHAATATVTGEVAGFPAATVLTYDGGASAPVDVGSYAVLAVLDAGSTNYSASPANGTIAITPASATVTLSDLTQTWDGSPHPVTVTTTPAGLAVAVTYDGSATPPTAVGTYAVSATVTDPNHSGSASGTLHVVSGDADVIAANGPLTFTGTAGEPLTGALPSVLVTDAGGNPVAGVTVTFVAGPDSGSLSGAVQDTGSDGIVTLGGWILDPEPGANTVTATAAGVTGSVVFTATGDPAAADMTVAIDDSREFVQALHVVTYTITISNNTASNESAVGVSNVLPAELDVTTAQWQCIPVNGATCTAVGSGDLVDTIDLPAHSGVVYVLTALVNGGTSDTIVNEVEVSSASGTITAFDTTMIVIFRDGFEFGGDGAEDPDNAGPVVALGELSSTDIVALDIDPDRVPHRVVTLAGTPDGSLRVDAIRIGGTVWLRLVARSGGMERASAWSELIAPGATLGLYNDDAGNPRVLLIGTVVDLDLAAPSGGPLVLVRGVG